MQLVSASQLAAWVLLLPALDAALVAGPLATGIWAPVTGPESGPVMAVVVAVAKLPKAPAVAQ